MLVRSGVLCPRRARAAVAPRRAASSCAMRSPGVTSATVQQLLAGPPINPMKPQGTCVPAAAVFGVARPDDTVLTAIGVELVNAGLPADASWIAPGHPEPVWAIEAAASNGNVELVRALARGRTRREEPRGRRERWCRPPAPDTCRSSSCSCRRAPTSRRRPAARRALDRAPGQRTRRGGAVPRADRRGAGARRGQR